MPLVGPSVRLSHILESYCHPQTVKEGDMAKTSFARPTVFDCRCITPPHGPVFHARYLPSRSRVGANKVGDANISLRASRCIVQCWHPFGSRAIELGRPPQGCVIYTVVYGYSWRWWHNRVQPCPHRPRAIKMAKDGPAFL